MWWGTIVGLGVGAFVSYSFILPSDILNLKLSTMTIGDILRMFGALIATGTAAYVKSRRGQPLKMEKSEMDSQQDQWTRSR